VEKFFGDKNHQQQEQELQQQPEMQQQNQGASVSIVPGASGLTDTAFQPNPVQVSVGTTVTWTNDRLDGGTGTDTCLSDPDPEVNYELD